MTKQEKEKRIKSLYIERFFFENYRKQASDPVIINDINNRLATINNEYYNLLKKI